MATEELESTSPDQTSSDQAPDIQLEQGTYEIIRNRLNAHGKELRSRLEKLNAARKDVFGSIETSLISTGRITTEHNCVPRDMVAVGSRVIIGYNVHLGLKTETELSDVFGVYEFSDNQFHAQSLDLIADEQFERDFREVYRYYKNAVFAKFFTIEPHLYMVMQIGKNTNDIKAFKWLVQDDRLTYVHSRSDHEVRFPPQHEFEWTRTHRDLHRYGEHPHVSIEDRVFVETVGGDLTVKIENNTDSGEGVYAEPVNEPDQTLDDAEIFYTIVGNIILLKIRPYRENAYRHIVYNDKIQQARRIDSIEHACVLLPSDHGLIFSNGYYLQGGEHKTFEIGLTNLMFERRIVAPNGEDYLFVFYNGESATYVLLRYNLISQRVDAPIVCHGPTLFEGGELVCFKAQEEPAKHHAVQIWRTPYVGDEFVPHTNTDSFLYKVGNRDLVRGMAECHEVLSLIDKEDTYANLYVDIAKETGDLVDSYFWIGSDDCFNLKETLLEIRDTASAAVDEFEKVVQLKKNTADQTGRVQRQTDAITGAIGHKRFDQIADFVGSLGELRAVRGEIISLRELRYVDLSLVAKLEDEVVQHSDKLSHRCVEYLLRPDSLKPYEQNIDAAKTRIGELTKVADAKKLEQAIVASSGELEMLIEIVGNLKIDDATQRTTIVDNISAIFAKVNAARAALKTKKKELLSVEGIAEFNSQLKLLNQGVVNYLDICDTPEKCEEFLTKVMIQIEELEGRFAEFDEFVVQLSEKRDEIYNAFETRKLSLIEARNKRANALLSAAERILKGIRARVDGMESAADINAYFASDLMIEKIRDIVDELKQLDDTVKVDDVQSRMKTIREDAVRQLKDRQELFVDGQNVIKFGNHRFSVNVQALDLTTVLRDGRLCLHLTGTNFFEPITDQQLLATREVWDQEVVSENRDVYRGEYLAYLIYRQVVEQSAGTSRDQAETPTVENLETILQFGEEQRLAFIQRFMGPRYSEAYVKGVHDNDASRILHVLLEMHASIGLLRYHTQGRALAAVYWRAFVDDKDKSLMAAKLKGFGTIKRLFPDTSTQQEYIAELREMLAQFVQQLRLFPEVLVDQAAEYLFFELTQHDDFCVSRTAEQLHKNFQDHLRHNDYTAKFDGSVKAVQKDAASRFVLLRDWVRAFFEQRGESDNVDYCDEVAALLLRGSFDRRFIVDGHVRSDLTGMLGSHPVIASGTYRLEFNQFMLRLKAFENDVVPRYRDYIDMKNRVVDETRDEMRLEEFRPRVLTSFVRNRLIDKVYLPLVGDNLAKQMGVVGEDKRTDLMGLLLLVSPPGYGKTTLMEYIANRLGIIFMKINGPAIGHQVTSLDPAEAPNAAAREELEKMNLSLEMGDNVMVYVDDIQHCNPEFLQKFISLCDAQRKIEGVYKGRTRTYDLRGRKVAVVMAGNPYTESGERFQIPDMLSNRADIYNLGEIIGDSADAFEMSYLENSLTSNPTLNKLATRSQKDVYAIIKMCEHGDRQGVNFEGNYSPEELNDFVAVMNKLIRIRDVVLKVNREYIRSAAQADQYRTEPAFKLQGSYRNMNRIAEKVVPIMNEEELEQLILTSYENDAQTLTSDTESNLLKLKELLGVLDYEEGKRWANIKRKFQQNLTLQGVDTSDQFGRVVAQLSLFNEGLNSIRESLTVGVEQITRQKDQSPDEKRHAEQLIDRLGGVQDRLEAIGHTLNGAISHLAESRATPQVVAESTPDKDTTLAADALVKLADELRALTTGAIPIDPNRPTQRVSVMHKVPRSILDVLNSQFELMQGWLEPILRMAHVQSDEIQQLRESLNTALENYSKLIQDLNEAETRAMRSKERSST